MKCAQCGESTGNKRWGWPNLCCLCETEEEEREEREEDQDSDE